MIPYHLISHMPKKPNVDFLIHVKQKPLCYARGGETTYAGTGL